MNYLIEKYAEFQVNRLPRKGLIRGVREHWIEIAMHLVAIRSIYRGIKAANKMKNDK